MAMKDALYRYTTIAAAILLCTLPWRAASKVVILQTNASGTNVHLIDPATNKIIGEITDIETPHGVGVAPDGTRIYVSNESLSTLDVVDAKTLKVSKRVPLSGHPNNMAVGKDGKYVFVGIAQQPGGVDVIDTASATKVKTIPTKGAIHNAYVTPDGKFVVSGSIGGKTINIADTKTLEPVWDIEMPEGIRPMTFSQNPDGSTKWIFAQLSGLNGFAVVDFATHKQVNLINNPALPPGRKEVPEGSDPSHGMAVLPDQKTLVVISRLNNAVYLYSLPDLKVTGTIFLKGAGAAWVTLTPDGKVAYVAEPVTDTVAVVDLVGQKQIASIPVGYVPKRNATGTIAQ